MLKQSAARDKKNPDIFLLLVIISLIAFGIIILSSVSAMFSMKKYGDSYYLLKHQIILGLLPGLILALFFYKINLISLKKWIPKILLATLILMTLVFLPFMGKTAGGATRWIELGPVTFQPSEFLKLVFVLYLATWLNSRTQKEKSRKDRKTFDKTFFAFSAIIIVIAILLGLQPNVSTLGIIVLTGFIMYFSARTPLLHSILIVLAGLASLLLLIRLAPYRMNRFLIFLHPDSDPMGLGYQLQQSLIAIGSGGLFGVGLGMSAQKLGFLPQSVADSVFAVFSEEMGFIGAVFLISLFFLFFWRGIKIAFGAKDAYFQLLALGIICWIMIQTFVNIGAMIGLLPLTGVPLPFVSYGGSALMIEIAAMGILLNISRQS